MKKFLIAGLGALLLSACGPKQLQHDISGDDRALLIQLHENYRNYWLQNDSAKVVNLFSEDGAIIPPGNKGAFIKGKKAIGAWWFTKNGDTTYPITKFVYKNDTLAASSGVLAAWEGVSELEWNTVAGNAVLSNHTSASNFITLCKKEGGAWKIYRQIWNVKPAK